MMDRNYIKQWAFSIRHVNKTSTEHSTDRSSSIERVLCFLGIVINTTLQLESVEWPFVRVFSTHIRYVTTGPKKPYKARSFVGDSNKHPSLKDVR
jgi:hypothetical protein